MTTPRDEGRDAALAWMAGRLRFEQLLADLHHGNDGTPVEAEVFELVDERTDEAA
jgi:hypothetical protein